MLRCLFFQASGYLTRLKSQTRDLQLKVPPEGLVLIIFSSSAGFESANLGSRDEHVTPRLQRPNWCPGNKILLVVSLVEFSKIFVDSIIKMLVMFWGRECPRRTIATKGQSREQNWELIIHLGGFRLSWI